MYKIWIRQPWDVSWQRYDHTKTFLIKALAEAKVNRLKKSNWWNDRTEYHIGIDAP